MEYYEVKEKNTRDLKFVKEINMKEMAELNNRLIRDAWLKEHGGEAVKEDGIWYWIEPEKPVKVVKEKLIDSLSSMPSHLFVNF